MFQTTTFHMSILETSFRSFKQNNFCWFSRYSWLTLSIMCLGWVSACGMCTHLNPHFPSYYCLQGECLFLNHPIHNYVKGNCCTYQNVYNYSLYCAGDWDWPVTIWTSPQMAFQILSNVIVTTYMMAMRSHSLTSQFFFMDSSQGLIPEDYCTPSVVINDNTIIIYFLWTKFLKFKVFKH